MRIIGLLLGITLIATILWDTFETIILPRRVTRARTTNKPVLSFRLGA